MSLIEAVTVPKWGMTMTEGKITQWMVGAVKCFLTQIERTINDKLCG